MKATRLLVLALSFALLACSSGKDGGIVPRPAPYTRFVMLDGSTVPLEQFKGKNTVVIFWAEWCTASSSVIRRTNELAQKLKNRPDVVFLAASVDKQEDYDKYLERVNAQKMDGFKHAFSGNEVLDEAYITLEAGNLPQVYVIDKQGTIVATGHSYGTVTDGLEELGVKWGR